MKLKLKCTPQYEEFKHEMKIGDVVAFGGDGLICKLIKWFSGYPYSHVALVYDVREGPNGEREILLAESNAQADCKDDIQPDRITVGVQMHFLQRQLGMYGGMPIWWVPLKEPLPAESIKKLQTYVQEVYDQYIGFDWPGIYGIGFEMITGLGLFTQPDFTKFFCSEFVTRALVESGVVPEGVNPSRQTPGSVVNSPCFLKPVPLTEAAKS